MKCKVNTKGINEGTRGRGVWGGVFQVDFTRGGVFGVPQGGMNIKMRRIFGSSILQAHTRKPKKEIQRSVSLTKGIVSVQKKSNKCHILERAKSEGLVGLKIRLRRA